MGRKFVAAAVALLLATAAAGADVRPPKGKRKAPERKAPARKGPVRLEEVKIVGNPERPDILFFLPRAKFRLLPPAAGADWREEILRDDIEKAGPP